MMNDRQAREILVSIWQKATGLEPTIPELQYVQAVGRFEGNYGSAWNNANNWGAIQCNHAPPCVPGECIETGDSQATGQKYTWCYRVWPTPEAGALGFVPLLTVKRPRTWEAMKKGQTLVASEELYGYYEGVFNSENRQAMASHYGVKAPRGTALYKAAQTDPVARKAFQQVTLDHAKLVYSLASGIAKSVGEPLMLEDPTSPKARVSLGEDPVTVPDHPVSSSLSDFSDSPFSYVLKAGDTAYELARKRVKNGNRWREILPLNPGIKVVRIKGIVQIRPWNVGQKVKLPW
jgi:hypothetical protein